MGTVLQKEWKEEEACRSRPLFTYCSRINDIQPGWVRFHSNARFRQPTISRGNNNFQLHSYYQWSFFFCGGYPLLVMAMNKWLALKFNRCQKNIPRSTHTHMVRKYTVRLFLSSTNPTFRNGNCIRKKWQKKSMTHSPFGICSNCFLGEKKKVDRRRRRTSSPQFYSPHFVVDVVIRKKCRITFNWYYTIKRFCLSWNFENFKRPVYFTWPKHKDGLL